VIILSEKATTLFEIIKNRRSIRAFTNQPVPDDYVTKILEAGWWAPSAGNRQPVEYVIIKDPIKKQRLSSQSFVEEAPVVIVVVVNKERTVSRYGERGERLYIYHDSGAAIQNMLLMAYALGLGTCWVGAFNDKRVAEVLDLPENILPVAIIPIGYPAEKPEPPNKIPLEKITHQEKYEEESIKEY